MVILLSALALFGALLHRLGLFRPYRQHRTQRSFEALLLQIGEEVEWEEHMTRAARRLPVGYRTPCLSFK